MPNNRNSAAGVQSMTGEAWVDPGHIRVAPKG